MDTREENEYHALWLIASGVNLRTMQRVIRVLIDDTYARSVVLKARSHSIVLSCARPIAVPIEIKLRERRYMIPACERSKVDNSWRDGKRGRKGKTKYRRG